jgi:hypothetical protein
LDELVSGIIRCTLGEGSVESVVVIFKFIIGEVDSIEGKINPHFITTAESRWRSALHGILINIVGWHESNWSIEVIFLLHTSVIFISRLLGADLGESAHDSLKSIGSIGEFLALEPDLGTTGNVSVSWSNIVENWLLVVSKVVSSVNPVNSVEGNLDLNGIALGS